VTANWHGQLIIVFVVYFKHHVTGKAWPAHDNYWFCYLYFGHGI